jgi:hypothetical protein
MRTKFFEYYETLEASEKKDLKALIIGKTAMSDSSLSNKRRGISYFNKLEREAITNIVNELHNKELSPEELFAPEETKIDTDE